MKILLIGANGLIGYNIFRNLIKSKEFNIFLLVRSKKNINNFYRSFHFDKLIELKEFKNTSLLESFLKELKPSIVLNCAGITKHSPNIKNISEVLYINSIFPRNLSEICSALKIRLIHLSSDCIFSGSSGMYKDKSFPDANDLYGISKALGEIDKENHLTIRTSTIGHEAQTSYGLLNWFLKQKECKGYKNAIFSGPTTLELSKILKDLIIPNQHLSGVLNISSDPIDKYSLLKLIKDTYSLDTVINKCSEVRINRSLNSEKFRTMTNYSVKSWGNMIREMYLDSCFN